ncbi:MAG: UTRA domain-containing protein [Gammaproteobacteria bacterium]|nr:UTRA domain-containing protein [Gammaproteobacteria bacterium]
MNKTIPAYQQIKQHILDAIHRGDWRAGTAIPTEMRLAEQFDVSRMTVNRALKELSEEKVLERRQGSGTFVAQQQFNHTFVEVRNIAEDIRKTGKSYSVRVIQADFCNYSDLPDDAQKLFKDSQQLFQIDIVHCANEKPIQYEKRWVDTTLVPTFSNQDFSTVNPSDFLISNVPLVKGQYLIQAIFAPAKIAEKLEISMQQPALVLSRYTFSSDERIVTYVQMWHDGSEFHFSGLL